MPELPEVETVRRTLLSQVKDKTIKTIKVLYKNIIDGNKEEFVNALTGKKIQDIKRHGKFLIFILSGDIVMLSHLRMEGKYLYRESANIYNKHEHIVFVLDNGYDLIYKDVRKFGRMYLRNIMNYKNTNPLAKLGLEPFSDDLTPEYLLEKFKNKKKSIKEVLLSQDVICGHGNIYVDEALFASKIHPKRSAMSISKEEAIDLIKYSKQIFSKAIEEKGTTLYSYSSGNGVIGNYQNFLKVHKREGLPCPICSTPIEKIKIGGRSTYFCPNCQNNLEDENK